jgi:hypothetical protein
MRNRFPVHSDSAATLSKFELKKRLSSQVNFLFSDDRDEDDML